MRRTRKAMAEMNVVPYIDVMLVLLVIFMVTAPMLHSGVDINLPQANTSPLASDNQQEPLIINVDQMGQYFLQDGTALTLDGISHHIATELAQQQRPVYVRADESVQYKFLMAAMVALQDGGAANIGLMADPLPAERY